MAKELLNESLAILWGIVSCVLLCMFCTFCKLRRRTQQRPQQPSSRTDASIVDGAERGEMISSQTGRPQPPQVSDLSTAVATTSQASIPKMVESINLTGDSTLTHMGDKYTAAGAGSNLTIVKNFYNDRTERGIDLSVPERHHQAVHRKKHEDFINGWLKKVALTKVTRKFLLKINGLGSAGKTCLAIEAAAMAKKLCFHVLWVRPGEKKDWEEIMQQHHQMKAKNEKTLLIVDDVKDDGDISEFTKADYVIITCRDEVIGRDSPFKDNLTIMKVEGLEENEAELLVKTIVGDHVMEVLENDQRIEKVKQLLDSEFRNFPLSTQLLSIILRDQFQYWMKINFHEYMEGIKKKLETTKETLHAKANTRRDIPAYTKYTFGSTKAAIFHSFERLNEEQQERYKHLVLFRQAETINLITATVMWGCKDKLETWELLKEFRNSFLLTQTDEGKFVLHDLVHNVLTVWAKEELKRLSGKIMKNYMEKAKSINEKTLEYSEITKEDEWFFRRFVSCSKIGGETEAAVETVCHLAYLSSRLGYNFADCLEEDLAVLLESSQRGKVVAWRHVVTEARKLDTSDRVKALDSLIRSSLLQPHDEDTYLKSKEALDKGVLKDRPFLAWRESPVLGSSLKSVFPVRTITLPEDAEWWSDFSVKSEKVAVGFHEVVYFYDERNSMIQYKSKGRIVLVKFIDDKVLVVVTGELIDRKWRNVRIVTLEFGGEVQKLKEFPLSDDERMWEVKFAEEYLWLLTEEKLKCFRVGRETIEEKEEFGDLLKYYDEDGRLSRPSLTISRDGRTAVVGNKWSTQLQVIGEEKKVVEMKREGKVKNILDGERTRLLMWRDEGRKVSLWIFDVDREEVEDLCEVEWWWLEYSLLIDNVFIFGYGSRSWRLNLSSKVVEEFRLSVAEDYPNIKTSDGMIADRSRRKKTLTLYDPNNVEDSAEFLTQKIELTGKVKLFEWDDKVGDFVFISIEEEKEMRIFFPQTKKEFVVEGNFFHFSVASGRLAAVRRSQETCAVEEFDLLTGNRRWSLPVIGEVSGVSLTEDGSGLWASVNCRVLFIHNGQVKREVETELEDVEEIYGVNEDICVCRHSYSDSLSLLRGGELQTKRIYDDDSFSLNRRHKTLVFTGEGVEDIVLWDLVTGKDRKLLLKDQREELGFKDPWSVKLSSDNRKCCIGFQRGVFLLLELETGEKTVIKVGGFPSVHHLCVDHDFILANYHHCHHPRFLLVNHKNKTSNTFLPNFRVRRIRLSRNFKVAIVEDRNSNFFIVDVFNADLLS